MNAYLDEVTKKLRRSLADAGIENHELVVADDLRQVRVPIGGDGTAWVDVLMLYRPDDGWAYRLIYAAYGHAETVAATDEPRDIVALIRRRLVLDKDGPAAEADWLRAGVRPEIRHTREEKRILRTFDEPIAADGLHELRGALRAQEDDAEPYPYVCFSSTAAMKRFENKSTVFAEFRERVTGHGRWTAEEVAALEVPGGLTAEYHPPGELLIKINEDPVLNWFGGGGRLATEHGSAELRDE